MPSPTDTLRSKGGMEIGVRFGKRLKALRDEAGFSQEELAHAAGLSRVYVGAVERGEQVPSLDTLDRLASALRVGLPAMTELDGGSKKDPSRADRLGHRIALLARGASARDVVRFERLARAFFAE